MGQKHGKGVGIFKRFKLDSQVMGNRIGRGIEDDGNDGSDIE